MSASLSRRSFVLGGASALSLGALSLAGCSAASGNGGAAVSSVEWSEEADVVVVGFGGAGAAAAINASEAGASVIILEKASEKDAGGNTSVSGGTMCLADPNNLDTAFEFIRYQMPDTTTDEEIEGYLEESSTLQQWLVDHGANVETNATKGSMYGALESAVAFPTSAKVGGNGFSLFTFLKGVVESSAGVSVRYETPASKLVFDPETREVYGVLATAADGSQLAIKAKKAVILCCGGFENNHQMKTAFYPPEVPIYPCGTPYNTGDGIEMITEIGAQLRGFSSVEWGCHCCKPASEEVGVSCGFTWTDFECWSNSIMVNARGQRFVNESGRTVSDRKILRPLHDKSQIPELAFSMDTLSYADLPMFFICDNAKVKAGPVFNNCSSAAGNHWANIHEWYTWSDDNQAEIDKGWLVKADTIEELAGKLGVDPAGLAATVQAYNEACAAGADAAFGRTDALSPVSEPPYYGCELGLGIINTQGGPVRDGAHHVLDTEGNPIPRLYAGGEFGSLYCWLYQGAGNVPEALGARTAGTNAAAEEPWD
ncbi:MAG TPA: FAD-binding protein [Candidatus Gordonibacter avicola]|nr:FAD-binding protein [Candidatus Gordonibacter avicola]